MEAILNAVGSLSQAQSSNDGQTTRATRRRRGQAVKDLPELLDLSDGNHRRTSSPSRWDAVLKNTDLSPRVQQHLVRVYTTLVITMVLSTLGAVLDLQWRLGGALSSLGSVLLLVALAMEPKEHVQKRAGMLGLFGLLQGVSLGPLIRMALHIDSSIVALAFGGTVAVFACFTLSALFSTRRSYLYLGAMLSSACSFLALTSLVSLFWRPIFLWNIQLYFGLAVFCAFLLYDTQLIVEKAELGSNDHVSHATELFQDAVAIFVRLLIILMQNANKRDEKKDRKRR